MLRRLIAVASGLLLLGTTYALARAAGEAYPPPVLRGVVVAVDAGHGGVDGGAAAPGRRIWEKDLTLEVARRLRDELRRAGATVVLTREADVDPSGLAWGRPDRRRRGLQARVDTGVRADAAAFVSLHMDSSHLASDPRHGPNAYYGPGKAQQGRGRLLAAAIQRRFQRAFGVKAAVWPLDAYVLRENPVPATLIECAFLNNAQDLTLIRDPAYQAALARAIVAGLGDFLSGGAATTARRRPPGLQQGPEAPPR